MTTVILSSPDANSARSSVAVTSFAFMVAQSFQATMKREKSSSTVERAPLWQPSLLTARDFQRQSKYYFEVGDEDRVTCNAMASGDALMPIRPEYRWFYPIDWPQLLAADPFGRAKGRCEHCRHSHGRLVFHLGDGRWWDEEAATWRNGRGPGALLADASAYLGR